LLDILDHLPVDIGLLEDDAEWIVFSEI